MRGSCTGLVLLCNSDAVSLALVWSAAAACAQAGHAASVLLQVQVGCGLSGNTGVSNLQRDGEDTSSMRDEFVRLVVDCMRRHPLQQLTCSSASSAICLEHEGNELPAVLRTLRVVLPVLQLL